MKSIHRTRHNAMMVSRFVVTSTAVMVLSFFFSSRRRHTRFDCDWSSDVCSSDLLACRGPVTDPIRPQQKWKDKGHNYDLPNLHADVESRESGHCRIRWQPDLLQDRKSVV